MIRLESQMMIGLNGVVSLVLQFIRQQLIHQPNTASFLQLVNQDAASALRNRLHRKMKLISTIAPSRSENIAGHTLRVDADQCCLSAGWCADHERERIFGFV